jgi:hypothetical protein
MHVMSSKKCVDHYELGLGTFHLLTFFFLFCCHFVEVWCIIGRKLGVKCISCDGSKVEKYKLCGKIN